MFTFRFLHIHRPVVAALLAVSLVAPALAAEMQSSTVQVAYGDLNLTSREGVDGLRHRLVVASRRVCGEADINDPTAMADLRACRADALDNALATLRRVVAAAQSSKSVAVATRN